MIKTSFVSIFALTAAISTQAAASTLPDSTKTPSPDDDTAIVVTATRSGDAIPASLLGSSVTVLDPKTIEQRQTRVVSDILRDVPGVAVSRTGAIGGQTQIRIRGSEANHVLVFIDGIKASDPYYGEYDFGNLLADDTARIEVLRGQQSALYGSDAIGGVISYTTLSGREAPGIRMRVEGGSYGTVSTAGRAAGTIGNSADYALSATYLTTSGYATAPGGQRDIGSNNLGTSGKFNWSPAPNLKVSAVARYSYTKADLNDQAISATSPVVRGYPVITAVDTPQSDYRNEAFYGLVRAELGLFDGIMTNALSAQITDVNRDAYNAYGYSYGDRGRRYRGSFETTVRFGNARVKNRFTAAVDAEREEFRAVDPSGYAFTGQHSLDTLGFVAQYDVTIDDRLSFGASARIDDYNRFEDASTYRVTGSYKLATGTRLHAAYGTGVKAPSATELFGYVNGQYIGNPDLKPERSRGWEAGLEQSFFADAVTIGATYFRNRFTDQIETVGTYSNGAYISTSRNNAVRSRQQGIETYGTARLGDWRMDVSYTYLKAPQTLEALINDAPSDGSYQSATSVETQAVRRPKHSGSLNLGYVPESLPFSATLTIRHNGRQRDTAFNALYQRLLVDLKSYTLVNLAASYDLTENVQVFGRVENLFNDHYQEVFTFETAGRAAYGGVRVRF